MEINDIERAIEGILFASGEPVALMRIAQVLGVPESDVTEAAEKLRDAYVFDRRGIRLVFLDRAVQLCSSPEYADTIRMALETRKQPQLSQQALEVLAIIAYFQPVTKTYIEQVRGVDSAYTVGLLQDRGLIEPCGRLSVPGRPLLFRTTPAFLRTFGISAVSDLPELPESGQPEALDAPDSDEAADDGAVSDGEDTVPGPVLMQAAEV
ncbi:SMC-Scp complex subunit ScpB [Oscillospiraceae bacterium CM]|nr:SMC-Scp complex subunit ScpB [Oscillospiraceae bacterium CM]